MILHQSAIIATIVTEIEALFFYYQSRNQKLSPSSKLRTESLLQCDVKFFTGKTQRICKMTSKEDKIMIKNTATRKDVQYKEMQMQFPNKHWPLTTAKRRQRKIDDTGTVNRQLGSGRKRKVFNNEKFLLNKSTV